jgi:hypothetical protein
MTTEQARKVLGYEADNLTDEEIRSDIDTADLFKELFFNNLIKSRKQDSKKLYNMP